MPGVAFCLIDVALEINYAMLKSAYCWPAYKDELNQEFVPPMLLLRLWVVLKFLNSTSCYAGGSLLCASAYGVEAACCWL
jgi:hypothetical protein